MNLYLRIAGTFLFIIVLLVNNAVCLRAEDELLREKAWVSEIASVFDEQVGLSDPARGRTGFLKNYKEAFLKLDEAGNGLAGLFLEAMEDDPVKKAAWAEKNRAGNSSEMLKRAAEDGAEAQLWLGLLYRQGISTLPQNEEEGNKWLSRAAENGNPEAFEAVFFPMMINSPDKAWPWVEELAVKGSAPAIKVLADQYYQMVVQAQRLGQPMKEDSLEAQEIVKWQKLAVEKGSLQASLNLYHMYNDGLAVDKNETEAVKWLKRAAGEGDLSAQITLGLMYFNGGSSAENDMDKAVEYYRAKAEAGDNEARFFLGTVYAIKAGQGGDLNEAVNWLEKAYEGGDARAAFILGRAYIYSARTRQDAGEVEADRKKAELWLTRASEQGIEDAAPLLDELRRK